MMVKNNLRMAIAALRSSRGRSLLTMLGIIIGIVSVVTVVSVGEGVKRSIAGEADSLGSEMITILPGKQISRDDTGTITRYDPFGSVGYSLTEADLAEIRDIGGARDVVPFVRVAGVPYLDGDSPKRMPGAHVLAVSGDVPRVLNQEVRFGTWLEDDASNNRRFAVIGSQVALDLFDDPDPIGRSLQLHDQTLTVRGVFTEFSDTSIAPIAPDYNNAIFVSYEENRQVSSNGQNIYQIIVNPDDTRQSEALAERIEATLTEVRDSSVDFTVLRRSDTVQLYDGILDTLTIGVGAIAAISLFVAGVGIMNIMFVSVSERTGEIGVRKAIGATNAQILGQFITEAIVLSLLGGIFGVLASLLANYFLRILTPIEPVILPEVMILATMTAFAVGVLFGTAPAIRAARKDPIDSLRYRL